MIGRLRLGQHGVVGNLSTVALVGSNGSIDFLCWPKLDSPSIFAGLLDPKHGGSFELAPEISGTESSQIYLPDTNILSTTWRAPQASAEVIDFMTIGADGAANGPRLIRIIRALRGVVPIRLSCGPTYDYGKRAATAEERPHGVRFSGASGDPTLRLSGTRPILVVDRNATSSFQLRAGEAAAFILEDDGPDCAAFSLAYAEEAAARTRQYWQAWSGRSTYRGRWQGQMTRSALALKLLTSWEHGSIAAAATFGLPEREGGDANWDYRATWIRDASFTVYAFVRLGHIDEVVRFMRWIGDRTRDVDWDVGLRIMYRLDGGSDLDERVISQLAGYQGSLPVRIGNAAAQQSQLDIYGELLDSVYLNAKYGEAPGHDAWRRICRAVAYICENWREPDAGIWEIRTEPQHFLYSRLMCWVAVDRALRLSHKRSLPADLPRWTRLRDEIHDSIWMEFWNAERGHFVQAIGSEDVDGALLLMPLVRFVTGTDPRWLATLDRIQEQLVDGVLVFRTPKALRGSEGGFAACTFWYVECLARAGRLSEAQDRLEQALGLANHVGLYAEEFDIQGRPLGNFPQALTHLALVSAVYYVDRQLSQPYTVR